MLAPRRRVRRGGVDAVARQPATPPSLAAEQSRSTHEPPVCGARRPAAHRRVRVRPSIGRLAHGMHDASRDAKGRFDARGGESQPRRCALTRRTRQQNHRPQPCLRPGGRKRVCRRRLRRTPSSRPGPLHTPRTRRGTIRHDSSRRRAAFVYAAHNLPQPFAIVESGTLCGATTLLLAALKRAHCPKCPFYSLDPGGFRATKGQPLSCARDAIGAAGYTHPSRRILHA